MLECVDDSYLNQLYLLAGVLFYRRARLPSLLIYWFIYLLKIIFKPQVLG